MPAQFCGNCATEIMVDFPNGPPGMKLGLNVSLESFAARYTPTDSNGQEADGTCRCAQSKTWTSLRSRRNRRALLETTTESARD